MGQVCTAGLKQQIMQINTSHNLQTNNRKAVNPPNKKITKEIEPQTSYIDEIQIDSIKLYQVQQRQMTQKLHKNVVAIIWKQTKFHADTIGRGSGLLISKDLVLTSAHNFYNKKERIGDAFFEIYPCQYGPLIKPYKICQVFIPPQFHNKKEAKFDYALVKLKEKVNNQDFFCLKSQVQNKGQALSIFGYPANKYQNKCKQQNTESVVQWGLIKKEAIALIQQNGYEILHKVSTHPGQSGSAIIQILGKEMSVVGIHKGAKNVVINGQQMVLNVGIRLVKQIVNVLRSAAIQMGGQMFSEYKEQKSKSGFGKENGQNWLIKGRQNYMLGKYDQAIQCFKEVVGKDHSNDYAYFLLGNSYLKFKCLNQAIESFKKTIKINPRDSQAHYNLGNAYLEINDFDSSINSYKQAIKVSHNNFQAYYNLAKVYQNVNNLLQAIQNFNMAVLIKSNDFQAWISLGNVYKKTKKFQKAIESFQKATIIKPDSAQAFNSLGSAYQDIKEYTRAVENFSKAIKLKPKYQNAYYNLAIALQGLNKMQEAIKAYKKAIQINPKYHIAYNNLGLAYFNIDQKQQAIKSFKKAIQIKSDYGPAYYNLGEALQKTNNTKHALVYYEKYLYFNPEDTDVIHKVLWLKRPQ